MSSFIVVMTAAGVWAKIATTLNSGVHTLNVTTGVANSALSFRAPDDSFVRIATVLTGDVHTIAAQAV